METQVWKPIKGYEGCYEISDCGIVRSIERVVKRDFKHKKDSDFVIPYKIKTPYISKNGYVTVALVKNNITKNTYLHRLIATAFVPNPENLKIVNHKNGIKTDNRIENLEWCTSGFNNQHAINFRLRKPSQAVLTEATALKIIEMNKQMLSRKKIAEILNISRHTVATLLSKRGYKYLNVQ